MAKKKSKAQLEAELRVLRGTRVSEGVVQVINNLIRWSAIVLVVRYGYLAIETLAGKTTLADVAVSFLTDIKVSVVLAWGAGAGGVVYGLQQRKLRKDTLQRLQDRNQTLEKMIDSSRSTSNLTPRGDTRPEDKI